MGACVAVVLNARRNPEIQLKFRGFHPDGSIISAIYSVGVPSIVMSSIGSVMVFGMNKILISFTTTATAVFGVYFKLQSFIFMPVFGLTNGMVPIAAYNYGARKPERIVSTIRLAMCYATGMMLLGLLIFEFFSPQLMGLFQAKGSTGELVGIGTVALRTIAIHFVFAGFAIVSSSVFQALGLGVLSLVISVVRQLVVLLPAAFILSKIGGLNAVWWAFLIAELASVAMCISDRPENPAGPPSSYQDGRNGNVLRPAVLCGLRRKDVSVPDELL